MRSSWQLTRGRVHSIAGIVGIVAGSALLVAAGLASVGLVPTRWADSALPEWAPLIAAISLAVIELGIFFLVGLAVAVLARAAMISLKDPADGPVRRTPASIRDSAPGGRSALRRFVSVAVAVVVLGALAASNASAIAGLASGENTVLVAHRGISSNAVENTIPALEAAAAARPDYVEIDVQETRDGDFAVFHDPTLRRLADDPREIGSMTMAELRRVVLRQGELEGRISSLEEFIFRAERLEQPLLIELKTRGDETPGYLENLAAILREHDVADRYLVASFDKAIIEEFAELEPSIPAGYVVRFNLGHAPSTTADFLVINSSSYSPALRDDAWNQGLSLFVWTVDDMPTVRDLLRDSVDGIITNRTNAAQAERQQIRFETGVAARLEDLVRRTFGF